jgi:hypothetical protein
MAHWHWESCVVGTIFAQYGGSDTRKGCVKLISKISLMFRRWERIPTRQPLGLLHPAHFAHPQ